MHSKEEKQKWSEGRKEKLKAGGLRAAMVSASVREVSWSCQGPAGNTALRECKVNRSQGFRNAVMNTE